MNMSLLFVRVVNQYNRLHRGENGAPLGIDVLIFFYLVGPTNPRNRFAHDCPL